jgi:hypothetical protein
LTRIELLERSISETLSNTRASPAPSMTSRATSASKWEFVEGARTHNMVSECRVARAVMRVEGMGRRYTAYEVNVVTGGGQSCSVAKRFSDFLELHNSLCSMYPMLLMPPVASQLFASRTRSCRRVWLDEYMTCLVRTGELNKSQLVNNFLSASGVSDMGPSAQLLSFPLPLAAGKISEKSVP